MRNAPFKVAEEFETSVIDLSRSFNGNWYKRVWLCQLSLSCRLIIIISSSNIIIVVVVVVVTIIINGKLVARILYAGLMLVAMHGVAELGQCAVSNGGCSPLAQCTYASGTVTCTCIPGYSGDGHTCSGNITSTYFASSLARNINQR